MVSAVVPIAFVDCSTVQQQPLANTWFSTQWYELHASIAPKPAPQRMERPVIKNPNQPFEQHRQ